MMCQGVYFLILILLEKSLSFLDLWFGIVFFFFFFEDSAILSSNISSAILSLLEFQIPAEIFCLLSHVFHWNL